MQRRLALDLTLGLVLAAAPAAHADTLTGSLRNTFTGDGKGLDVVNDAKADKLLMAPCGDYSGQSWPVTPS